MPTSLRRPPTPAPPAPAPPHGTLVAQDTGIARTHLSDQYYTRTAVAIDCIRDIVSARCTQPHTTWVEPSAGSGAFIKALRHIMPRRSVLAFDTHPQHPQVHQQDFLAWEPISAPQQSIIVFGNPPFGRRSAGANAFIRHAAKFAQVIAFILPRSFSKPSMQHVFPPHFHLRHSSPIPHNAFLVNNRPHHVNCVFQIWTRESTPRPITPVTIPHHFEYTRDPHRNPNAPYDLALRRVGATAGTAHLPSLHFHNANTHYFIRLAPHLQHRNPNQDRALHDHINKNQHLFQKENTTGPRSISQTEFTAVINPYLASLTA